MEALHLQRGDEQNLQGKRREAFTIKIYPEDGRPRKLPEINRNTCESCVDYMPSKISKKMKRERKRKSKKKGIRTDECERQRRERILALLSFSHTKHR